MKTKISDIKNRKHFFVLLFILYFHSGSPPYQKEGPIQANPIFNIRIKVKTYTIKISEKPSHSNITSIIESTNPRARGGAQMAKSQFNLRYPNFCLPFWLTKTFQKDFFDYLPITPLRWAFEVRKFSKIPVNLPNNLKICIVKLYKTSI